MVEAMQGKLLKLSEVYSLAPTEVARAYKLAEMIGAAYDEASKVSARQSKGRFPQSRSFHDAPTRIDLSTCRGG
jgi:hypothetical protein